MDRNNNAHTHRQVFVAHTHTHTRVYTYINIDVWVFQSEEKQWSTQMSIRVLFTHMFWFWDMNFKCFCITDTAKLYVPPAKCQSDSESLCLCQIEDVRVTSKDRRDNISLQYTWLWSAAKRGKLWVFSCWRHPRASLTAPHLYFWDKCEIYFTVSAGFESKRQTIGIQTQICLQWKTSFSTLNTTFWMMFETVARFYVFNEDAFFV